jgi:hypothetical protein
MESVTHRIGLYTRFDKWYVVVLVMTKERIVIGPVEYVKVIGHNGEARVRGKIDTGATRTSVDVWLAANIGLGPTVDVAKVKSTLDEVRSRPLVRGIVEIAGEEFALAVSVDDRSDMRFPVLIGMDILRLGRFLIDPTKKTPPKYRGARETIKRKHRAHL